jgi:hypothetical protein
MQGNVQSIRCRHQLIKKLQLPEQKYYEEEEATMESASDPRLWRPINANSMKIQ